VLDSGYTEEGLFYFDMEYIQGITLAEYIKTMEIGKVKNLVKMLVSSVIPKKSYAMTQEEKAHATEIFSNKIKSLRENLIGKNNEIINQSLDLLETHDWTRLTPSQCHGDMSLENIIVKNDKLYFIDFLDSFYDSWFLDIGTLLQDVQVMWSYRFQDNVSMNTVLRLIVFRDLLLDEIRTIDEGYVIEIYYSLLQKLIRIYPYTNDEITYQFLNEKTEIVLENIRKLENTARGVA
jgi:thiamine kinase-like enzyme